MPGWQPPGIVNLMGDLYSIGPDKFATERIGLCRMAIVILDERDYSLNRQLPFNVAGW